MSFRVPTYYVLRRRIVRYILKLKGWKFRGQVPPATWPQLIFVSPAEGDIKTQQKNWVEYLTATSSVFFHESVDIEATRKILENKNTALISWDIVQSSPYTLKELFSIVRETDGRLSACAWDLTHKAIKFHSLFKPSDYSERDIKYLSRFFIYFSRI